MNENRDDQDRFAEQFSTVDFIQSVRACEIAGTREIAEEVGCSRETARSRLNELADSGELVRRKIGGRNVYTIAE